MDADLDYRSLALAGVAQAASLVHAKAQVGSEDRFAPAAAAAIKQAILTRNAQQWAQVFPDPVALESGARIAGGLLGTELLKGPPREPEVLRYCLQLIDLAAKLKRDSAVLERLGRLLDQLLDDPSDAQLACVYQSSISTLGQRIQVQGDPQRLGQEVVADEIRALLLGGVRFAWLWHQLGGRRWHLILQRRRVLLALEALSVELGRYRVIH